MHDTDHAMVTTRRLSDVMHRQDETSLRRLNLQKARHKAIGRRDTTAVAAYDVQLADLRTTEYDLRAAFEVAGGGDVAKLDRNGRTAGLNWQDVVPVDPRAYATVQQLAREEYGSHTARRAA